MELHVLHRLILGENHVPVASLGTMTARTPSQAMAIGFLAGVFSAGCAAVAVYRWTARTWFSRLLDPLHESGLSMRAARLIQHYRGGRLHIYDTIVAKNTALIVIDMQEVFLSESSRGTTMFCPGGRSLVPAINRAAAALRPRGGRVIWMTSDVGADSLSSWSVLYSQFFPETGGLRDRIQKSLSVEDGRWGPSYNPKACEHGMDGPLDQNLDVSPDDLIVKKDRFSPFAPGGKHQGCTPLDGPTGPKDFAQRLRDLGIDTLLLCGVSTAICVSATAQDAMQRNFRVTVLSDASAAGQIQDHVGQLDHLASLTADVRSIDAAIAAFS